MRFCYIWYHQALAPKHGRYHCLYCPKNRAVSTSRIQQRRCMQCVLLLHHHIGTLALAPCRLVVLYGLCNRLEQWHLADPHPTLPGFHSQIRARPGREVTCIILDFWFARWKYASFLTGTFGLGEAKLGKPRLHYL